MDKDLTVRLKACETDIEGALRRFMQNEALYEKFLYRFPEDKTFEQLRTAVNTKDKEAAFMAAHTLKGVAGNLGFTQLFIVSSEMTELFRGGKDDEGFGLLARVEECYNSLIKAINP